MAVSEKIIQRPKIRMAQIKHDGTVKKPCKRCGAAFYPKRGGVYCIDCKCDLMDARSAKSSRKWLLTHKDEINRFKCPDCGRTLRRKTISAWVRCKCGGEAKRTDYAGYSVTAFNKHSWD
jgi:predicted RNA-binding Zn-ribbon protein involved in translation (DUF1610 family)